MEKVKIAIVEDDHEIRNGIVKFIRMQKDLVCVHDSDSVERFLDNLAMDVPDVVIMDIHLPGMSGIEGIRAVKQRHPSIDVVMFTVYFDADKIFDSLCAGATGYLLKNTSFVEIRKSILSLRDGGAAMSPQIARKVIEYFQPKKNTAGVLSPKEYEVVRGLVDGLSYKMIADRMKMKVDTVKFHSKNIYRKLHVHSKSEVVAKSLRGEI